MAKFGHSARNWSQSLVGCMIWSCSSAKIVQTIYDNNIIATPKQIEKCFQDVIGSVSSTFSSPTVRHQAKVPVQVQHPMLGLARHDPNPTHCAVGTGDAQGRSPRQTSPAGRMTGFNSILLMVLNEVWWIDIFSSPLTTEKVLWKTLNFEGSKTPVPLLFRSLPLCLGKAQRLHLRGSPNAGRGSALWDPKALGAEMMKKGWRFGTCFSAKSHVERWKFGACDSASSNHSLHLDLAITCPLDGFEWFWWGFYSEKWLGQSRFMKTLHSPTSLGRLCRMAANWPKNRRWWLTAWHQNVKRFEPSTIQPGNSMHFCHGVVLGCWDCHCWCVIL